MQGGRAADGRQAREGRLPLDGLALLQQLRRLQLLLLQLLLLQLLLLQLLLMELLLVELLLVELLLVELLLLELILLDLLLLLLRQELRIRHLQLLDVGVGRRIGVLRLPDADSLRCYRLRMLRVASASCASGGLVLARPSEHGGCRMRAAGGVGAGGACRKPPNGGWEAAMGTGTESRMANRAAKGRRRELDKNRTQRERARCCRALVVVVGRGRKSGFPPSCLSSQIRCPPFNLRSRFVVAVFAVVVGLPFRSVSFRSAPRRGWIDGGRAGPGRTKAQNKQYADTRGERKQKAKKKRRQDPESQDSCDPVWPGEAGGSSERGLESTAINVLGRAAWPCKLKERRIGGAQTGRKRGPEAKKGSQRRCRSGRGGRLGT